MKLRYDYKKIAPATKIKPACIRPIIPTELATKNQERVRADSKDTFSGVLGKPATCYWYDVFLIVGGSNKNIIKCAFTDDLPDVAHGFLEQLGFFSDYWIQFNHSKQFINIWNNQRSG